LDRKIRPVGRAYKQLIKDWREVLPTQSVCLRVPVVPPQKFARRLGKEMKNQARAHADAGTAAPANRS
jgi:hypothetical protein